MANDALLGYPLSGVFWGVTAMVADLITERIR
jgi:hypothetical protein